MVYTWLPGSWKTTSDWQMLLLQTQTQTNSSFPSRAPHSSGREPEGSKEGRSLPLPSPTPSSPFPSQSFLTLRSLDGEKEAIDKEFQEGGLPHPQPCPAQGYCPLRLVTDLPIYSFIHFRKPVGHRLWITLSCKAYIALNFIQCPLGKCRVRSCPQKILRGFR